MEMLILLYVRYTGIQNEPVATNLIVWIWILTNIQEVVLSWSYMMELHSYRECYPHIPYVSIVMNKDLYIIQHAICLLITFGPIIFIKYVYYKLQISYMRKNIIAVEYLVLTQGDVYLTQLQVHI